MIAQKWESLLTEYRVSVLLYLITGLVLTLMAGPATLYAAERIQNQKILILNSYYAGYKGSDDIVLGFTETLRASFPIAEISIEYLDSKNNSGQEYDKRLLDIRMKVNHD